MQKFVLLYNRFAQNSAVVSNITLLQHVQVGMDGWIYTEVLILPVLKFDPNIK